MSEWLSGLSDQLGSTPLSNWVVFFFGMSHVALARANTVWLYPTGLVAMGFVFYHSLSASDYASMAFSAYYLVMLALGWIYWTARLGGGAFPVSYANRADWWSVLSVVAVGFFVLYAILAFAMDAAFPIWEAGVGATACAGVWLLNKRKIEHWVLLNVSQAFAIPLLFHSERFLYGALALFLYIFAFFGFFSWRRIIHQQRNFVRA